MNKNIKKIVCKNLALLLTLLFVFSSPSLYAADLSSTSFIIRDPAIGTGSGYSSSTSFGLNSSGNMNVQGYSSSASFIGQAGFLYYPGTTDPSLTFSLGSNSVALGTLSSSATSSGSHTVSISTNGGGGFAVTASGATLTNGSAVVDAIGATATTSSTNSEQFGLNLRDNTTPNVGANVTQNSGTCSYGTGFGTVDNFKFVAGSVNTLATASAGADCVYTVSYIANITGITDSGAYTTTLDFIGTGTF